MQLKSGQTWPAESDSMYDFARNWAEKMERAIAQGKTVAEVADASGKSANSQYQSQGSYKAAVATLADKWIYGDQLHEWHNGQK